PANGAAPANGAVSAGGSGAAVPADAATEDGALVDYFRRFVLEHEQMMSETELARRLGISRKALWERRQRLGIPRAAKR
ncbi:sigma-54-dependent Fis family transcriptional regulator, partial [Myxococcota bacterium]|nr:sigma-54-dependent Fis family transcriptional regulator [Myxococcota bacterium]